MMDGKWNPLSPFTMLNPCVDGGGDVLGINIASQLWKGGKGFWNRDSLSYNSLATQLHLLNLTCNIYSIHSKAMHGDFFYWIAKADAYAFGYVRSAKVGPVIKVLRNSLVKLGAGMGVSLAARG